MDVAERNFGFDLWLPGGSFTTTLSNVMFCIGLVSLPHKTPGDIWEETHSEDQFKGSLPGTKPSSSAHLGAVDGYILEHDVLIGACSGSETLCLSIFRPAE